jgi:hypothetical protein
MASHDEIRQLKKRHSAMLLGKPGVSGVGIEMDGDENYKLVVHLDDAAACAALPKQLDGHDIEYVVSGPFTKLPASDR